MRRIFPCGLEILRAVQVSVGARHQSIAVVPPTYCPLPSRREALAFDRMDIDFHQVSLWDDSIARHLRQMLQAHSAQGLRVDARNGFFLATIGAEVFWQLRPPPVLTAMLATGLCDVLAYQEKALDARMGLEASFGEGGCDRPAVLVLLAANRAAIGILRLPPAPGLAPTARQWRKPGAIVNRVLCEHKVFSAYTVRGGGKQGTGRFQLFEDARSFSKSEGASLRRHCAVRFFEKINQKLAEWLSPVGSRRRMPWVVFFSGDQRLRSLFLKCRKPTCPLPLEASLWIPLLDSQTKPSLENLARAAVSLSIGEVAQLLPTPGHGRESPM